MNRNSNDVELEKHDEEFQSSSRGPYREAVPCVLYRISRLIDKETRKLHGSPLTVVVVPSQHEGGMEKNREEGA